MKNYVILVIPILFILTGAGCGGGSNPNTPGGDLFANENRKCTSEYENGGTMVMYTDGENVRVESNDLETDILGEATYYTIADSEWIYTWNSGSQEGTKFPVVEGEEEDWDIDEDFDEQAFEEDMQSVDGYGEFTYSCERWNVDASMFVPPADVTFTDYSDFFSL